MNREQLSKATEIVAKIRDLKDHKENIIRFRHDKRVEYKDVRDLNADHSRLSLAKNNFNPIDLKQEFLSIPQSVIMEMYLKKVDDRINELEEELAKI
jgi:hypothetical protein